MTNNVQNWGVLHLETNALSPDDGGEILKIHIINSHGKWSGSDSTNPLD